ncbi:MAG: hypothetical protein KDA84_22280, partial [Planctomycetaceae bacterium]|nr:hypothetical protein [Planctomycetaceae bacterium]
EAEFPAMREEATDCLSAHRNPRSARQPGYCDPVTYVRWALDEQVVPRTCLGVAHGHLQGRNILVGIKENQAVFPAVFDYSGLSTSLPTVWDFVSLEVDLKTHVMPELVFDEEARQALAMAASQRFRFRQHGQTTVATQSKRADLNRSQRIEFAYQFELLLTDLLFNRLSRREVRNQASFGIEPFQTGHSSLDRALRLFHWIRQEAAVTLGRLLDRFATWQNEYLFALSVCGLAKIQRRVAAPQEEWCLISSGVAAANLDDFSRFVRSHPSDQGKHTTQFRPSRRPSSEQQPDLWNDEPAFESTDDPVGFERIGDTLIYTPQYGDFDSSPSTLGIGLETIEQTVNQPDIRHLILDFSQID